MTLAAGIESVEFQLDVVRKITSAVNSAFDILFGKTIF